MVAAAIGIGGAVAGLGGSLLSANAASSAASEQQQVADQASNNALAEYQQNYQTLQPYVGAGNAALGQLQNLLGIGGSPASTTTSYGGGGGAGSASGGNSNVLSAVQSALQSGGSASLPNGYTLLASPSGDGTFNVLNANGDTVQTINGSNGLTQYAQQIANDVGGGVFGQGQSGNGGTSTTVNPGVSAGQAQTNALNQYGLSGLTFQGNPNFTPVGGTIFNPTQASLAATPGYQFDLQQGLQATQNSNAAQGLGVSGAALKGAAAYATGLANNTLTTQQGIFNSNLANQEGLFSQNYGRAYNQFQSNLGNVINPLEYTATLGQNSAVQAGNQGIQATSNANQLAVGGANAAAAGTVGTANALSSGLTSAANGGTNYALLTALNNGGSGAVGGSNSLGGGGY